MIKLKKITKVYQSGGSKVYGVKDVDLLINDGEVVAITGPSGCGKSTLLNLIGGIDIATSGTVFVNGKDLRLLKDKALTKFRKENISFVFQFFNLISNLTASENVQLSLSLRHIKGKKASKEANKYLSIAGIGGLAGRFPSELSGGQQQRVAIARALAKKTKILLTDEPTGNIDSKSGQEVMDSLCHSHKELGTTIVIVTHDMAIAKRANRIIHMKDGKILKDEKTVNKGN